MKSKYPRIIIAGLKGGSGKTTLSLGLIAVFRKKGMKVIPFKKGLIILMADGFQRQQEPRAIILIHF